MPALSGWIELEYFLEIFSYLVSSQLMSMMCFILNLWFPLRSLGSELESYSMSQLNWSTISIADTVQISYVLNDCNLAILFDNVICLHIGSLSYRGVESNVTSLKLSCFTNNCSSFLPPRPHQLSSNWYSYKRLAQTIRAVHKLQIASWTR